MQGRPEESSLSLVSEPVSLLEFLQELLTDAGTRAGFLADPHGTLAEQGLADLSPADVHDALVLVEDTRTADFDPYGSAPAAAFGPPPAGTAHTDAVQYLSGYLTGAAGAVDLPTDVDTFEDNGFGEDVDADLLESLPASTDVGGFGAGDTAADLPAEDDFGLYSAEEAPASGDDLLDFGPGADPDVDDHGDDGIADPYAAIPPYDPGDPAPHHDLDL
jgi:hypothetical protein